MGERTIVSLTFSIKVSQWVQHHTFRHRWRGHLGVSRALLGRRRRCVPGEAGGRVGEGSVKKLEKVQVKTDPNGPGWKRRLFWGWHSKRVSEPCDFSWKTNYNSATATSTWIAMRAVQVVSYLLSQGSDLHLRLEDFRILRGLQELEMSLHLFPILEAFETVHARASKSRPVSAIFLCNANSVKTSAAFRPGIEVRPSAVGVTCSKQIHQFHGQLCPLSKLRGFHSSMGDMIPLGTYQPYPSVSMGTYHDLPSIHA